MDSISALDLWDLDIEVLHSSKKHPSTVRLVAEQTQYEIRHHGRTKKQSNKSGNFGLTAVDYVTPNAKNYRHNARCLKSLKTTNAVKKMTIKAEVGQRDTYLEPTELYLIGWLTGAIFDPTSQVKYFDTRNQRHFHS